MLDSYDAKLETPFAVLGIRTAGERVTDIDYLPLGLAPLAPLNKLAERTCRQLERYLDDPVYVPKIPFEYAGTPFQCRVWRAIREIPCGRTLTYKDIARALASGPRPVGGACGRNRVPIVIPCHRVLASGALGGFMGGHGHTGLAIKRWLLRHEGVKV
jgi:methylated-DNA-[protein]-cysteine S-methyltransferase